MRHFREKNGQKILTLVNKNKTKQKRAFLNVTPDLLILKSPSFKKKTSLTKQRLIVVFSVERFIAVYFPMSSKLIITSTKKRCSVACLIAISLVIYSLSLFTTSSEKTSLLVQHDSIYECVPLAEWLGFTKYMTLGDTVATIFIPFATISFLNLLIAFKLVNDYNNQKLSEAITRTSVHHGASPHLRMRLSPLHKMNANERSNDTDTMRGRFLVTKAISHVTKRKKAYSRATLVLLSISTSFLVLNFPLALDKVLYFVNHKSIYFSQPLLAEFHALYNYSAWHEVDPANYSMYSESDEYSENQSNVEPLEYLLNKLTANVHYLNFVLNFFLYSLNGAKFRQAVLKLFSFK